MLSTYIQIDLKGTNVSTPQGGRINLDAQMDNFANTRQDIISSIGSPTAMKLFNRALYSVTMGSNDFINNYLVPVLSAVEQKLISPQMFVDTLISRFRLQLTVFHACHYINVWFADKIAGLD